MKDLNKHVWSITPIFKACSIHSKPDMGQRFLGAMPCVAIVLTTYSLGAGPSWTAIIPVIDTTWDAVNLLLACSQSVPFDCSPHIYPILEDPWGYSEHPSCYLLPNFYLLQGREQSGCLFLEILYTSYHLEIVPVSLAFFKLLEPDGGFLCSEILPKFFLYC